VQDRLRRQLETSNRAVERARLTKIKVREEIRRLHMRIDGAEEVIRRGRELRGGG